MDFDAKTVMMEPQGVWAVESGGVQINSDDEISPTEFLELQGKKWKRRDQNRDLLSALLLEVPRTAVLA